MDYIDVSVMFPVIYKINISTITILFAVFIIILLHTIYYACTVYKIKKLSALNNNTHYLNTSS